MQPVAGEFVGGHVGPYLTRLCGGGQQVAYQGDELPVGFGDVPAAVQRRGCVAVVAMLRDPGVGAEYRGQSRQRVTGLAAGGQWPHARLSLVVHAAGGLLVLPAATVLAAYTPRGLTRYGHRRTVARDTASATTTPSG